MSIWTEGKKHFIFEAYKGREFAKRFDEKRDTPRGKTPSIKQRRRALRARQQAEECYRLHDQVKRTSDFKPFISPPK